MNDIYAVIQAATVSAEGWETAKGVMLTLSTAATMWIARTLFTLRDAVRDLKTAVGTDGGNGVISKVKQHALRLDAIEDRNLAIDAIAEKEAREYQGPERRQSARRLRDQLLPQMPPVDQGESR